MGSIRDVLLVGDLHLMSGIIALTVAAFAHNFALVAGPDTMADGVLKVGGPSIWRMWAVGIGIVICLLIGWTMRETIEEAA